MSNCGVNTPQVMTSWAGKPFRSGNRIAPLTESRERGLFF